MRRDYRKIVERLRAKADKSEFPEEAATFRSRADQIERQYSTDEVKVTDNRRFGADWRAESGFPWRHTHHSEPIRVDDDLVQRARDIRSPGEGEDVWTDIRGNRTRGSRTPWTDAEKDYAARMQAEVGDLEEWIRDAGLGDDVEVLVERRDGQISVTFGPSTPPTPRARFRPVNPPKIES